MTAPETTLARHVADLAIDRVPAAAAEAGRSMLLDYAAVALAGLKSAECRRIMARWRATGGAAEASAVGVADKLPAATAAFLNGVLAHWFEWDDTHDRAVAHIGAVAFPALLAAAEYAGRDGPRAGGTVLAAAIAAFDVAAAIAAPLKAHTHLGWMPTGIGSTVGAAAGAARMLGLDAKGIASAMGLAAMGAGLGRQALMDKASGKNVLAGQAARRALECALLAADGIEGARGFWSGRYGVNALLAGGKADIEPELAVLGRRFAVAETSVKPYPCCRLTHAAIDLALDLAAERPDIAGRVARVEVASTPAVEQMVGAPFAVGDNPRVAAQFSLGYTLGLTLIKGRPVPEDFEASRVAAAGDIHDFARRVRVATLPGDAGAGPAPLVMRLALDDGSVIERRADVVKGSAEHPLTEAEAAAKLSGAAGGLLDPAQVARLQSAVARVADDGLAPLAAVLRAAHAPDHAAAAE